MSTHRILVSGDYHINFDLYLSPEGCTQPFQKSPPRMFTSTGGAGIAHDLLQAVATSLQAASSPELLEVKFEISDDFIDTPHSVLWQPSPLGKLGKEDDDRDAKVWRAMRSLPIGKLPESIDASKVSLPEPASATYKPDVILVEDHVCNYRCHVPEWLQKIKGPEKKRGKKKVHVPQWIVLNTDSPVAKGFFWWEMIGTLDLADRLVVVLSLDDLRKTDIRVSKGISWERTAQDLFRELIQSPVLLSLRRAKHVVIPFATDGAVWMTRTKVKGGEIPDWKVTLFFDPGHMEGEWWQGSGEAQENTDNISSVFAASIATKLAMKFPNNPDVDLGEAIQHGLISMRVYQALGNGSVKDSTPTPPTGILTKFILSGKKDLSETVQLDHLHINWKKLGSFSSIDVDIDNNAWRILESGDQYRAKQQPLYGLARRVALFGLNALGSVPYSQFGYLFTVDRDEIEALGNIQRLFREYEQKENETKPLSIAVFGPPGAGKSFGIKQVAKSIIEKDQQAFLEFNLSQFKDPNDLIGAFHQVRDKVLEGKLPVVFWDEFDSGNYQWLQYLLAPMQDGVFQEGQLTHPIGRCVFVFAGATTYHIDNFGPPEKKVFEDIKDESKKKARKEANEKAKAEFILKKGPDFISRMHGSLNVLGPNPRQVFDYIDDAWKDDPSDVCFPVRRAILLRVWLGLMKPKSNCKRLNIDHGLLAALLDAGHYMYGARSMEKIVATVKLTTDKLGSGASYQRSALPSDEILDMNVKEADIFRDTLDGPGDFQAHIENIARGTHAAWVKKVDRKNAYNKGFDELSEEAKADNFEAAKRIPYLLGLVGLALSKDENHSTISNVSEILENQMELLAEEEHNAWMDVKIANGWTRAPITADKEEKKKYRANRQHDCLIPYAELSENYKELDRLNIRNIPVMAEVAGYKIVPLGSNDS